MFARYFFPDEGVFSFDRLRYLQSNVAGIGENPLFSAKALLARLGTLKSAGFLLRLPYRWWISYGRASCQVALPMWHESGDGHHCYC